MDPDAAVRGNGNIKKCDVNDLSISKDIIAYGWMEIQKMDLQTIRFDKIERNKRMKYMNNEVMQSVAGYGGRNNEGNFMDRALQRHMKAIVNNGVDN